MKDWIDQFEASIRDKKTEELKMESGLALRNGVLTFDKATGEHTLHANDGSYFIRDYKDYDYDPKAKCPRWMQALEEWFDYNPTYKDILQEYAGYCLTSWRHFEKFLIMHNKAGAGKNTIANVFLDLTSSSICNLPRLNAENICADKAHFKMLFCDEKVCDVKESVLDMLKQVVTTSPVHCRPLFERSYASSVFPKLLVAFNEIPKSFKMDEALLRRLLVIDFKNTFVPDKKAKVQVRNMDNRLGDVLKTEMSGILNWALEGLRRLCKNGKFTVHEVSNQTLFKKAKANDNDYYKIVNFIDKLECGEYLATDLYQMFKAAGPRLHANISMIKFGKTCGELEQHIFKKRTSDGIWYNRTTHKGLEVIGSDVDL